MALNRFAFNLVKNSLKFCPTKAVKLVSTKYITLSPVSPLQPVECSPPARFSARSRLKNCRKIHFLTNMLKRLLNYKKLTPRSFSVVWRPSQRETSQPSLKISPSQGQPSHQLQVLSEKSHSIPS